jgi:hypothetical protein
VQVLPVRVVGNGRLQLRDELAIMAKPEPGVEQHFQGHQAVVLQPRRGKGREARLLDVGEGRAPPQGEPGREAGFGGGGIATGQGGPALG